MFWGGLCFFFQAEDGIRDAQESRGLGDVYKRQVEGIVEYGVYAFDSSMGFTSLDNKMLNPVRMVHGLSLIHI